MSCNHDRTIKIQAHSSDLNFVSVPHLAIEKEGYLPHIDNICGGDDVNIEICLDCGKVVDFDGLTDKEVRAAMKGDDFDEDEDEMWDGDDENSQLRQDW